MCSAHPVSRIWEANVSGRPIKGLKIPSRAEHLLIIRPRAMVEVRRVSPGALAVLGGLRQGRSIAEAFGAGRAVAPSEDLASQLMSLARSETFLSMERSE
jgi:hypothetical protein